MTIRMGRARNKGCRSALVGWESRSVVFSDRSSVMLQALLADIGGSNSRFAVSEPGGRPGRVMVVDNESVSGPEAAIRRYLGETRLSPQIAVLAVAGLVDGDEIRLTNRDWRFNLAQVGERFGFASAHALNDFEAVAHALAVLRPDELRALGPVAAVCRGPRAVFGPGTGLGVAALLPNGSDWIAMASEGGHVSFGPAAPDERKVFQRLAQGSELITAETVISGPGLERIYRALNPLGIPLEAKTIVAQAGAGDRGRARRRRIVRAPARPVRRRCRPDAEGDRRRLCGGRRRAQARAAARRGGLPSRLRGSPAVSRAARGGSHVVDNLRRARPHRLCGRGHAVGCCRRLEHDPEKWAPVFGKDHAPTIS